jgi:hypothetical protein
MGNKFSSTELVQFKVAFVINYVWLGALLAKSRQIQNILVKYEMFYMSYVKVSSAM